MLNLKDELHHIGPEHGPQAEDRVIRKRQRKATEDCSQLLPRRRCKAERQRQYFGHRQVHPAHDDGVHRQREIHRTATPQKRRGPAFVPQFGELHVGEDLCSPPEWCEEKDCEHAA